MIQKITEILSDCPYYRIENPSFSFPISSYDDFLGSTGNCGKFLQTAQEGDVYHIQLEWAPIGWLTKPPVPGMKLEVYQFSIIDINYDFMLYFKFDDIKSPLINYVLFKDSSGRFARRLISTEANNVIECYAVNVIGSKLANSLAEALRLVSRITLLIPELEKDDIYKDNAWVDQKSL